MKEGEGLMSAAELAERLGVHILTLTKWRKSGNGPPFWRVGGKAIRYLWTDVLDWMERDEGEGKKRVFGKKKA